MKSYTLWTSQEAEEVILSCANRIIDHTAPMYGSNVSYGSLLVAAQEVLPVSRRRAESTLKTFGKASFGAKIDAKVLDILSKRAVARSTIICGDPARDTEVVSEEVIESVEPVESINPLDMSLMINTLAENFKKALVEALTKAANAAMEEVSRAPYKPSVVESSSSGKRGLIKIGILGGQAKGKDAAIIKNGLTDIYDFRFVDSLSEVESVKNCDLVLVRTSFISHKIIESVVRVLGNKSKMVNINSRSPNAVNDWLLDRYTSNISVPTNSTTSASSVIACH